MIAYAAVIADRRGELHVPYRASQADRYRDDDGRADQVCIADTRGYGRSNDQKGEHRTKHQADGSARPKQLSAPKS